MRAYGQEERLRLLGWDEDWAGTRAAAADQGEPGRVVGSDPRRPLVATAAGDVRAPATVPLVAGDWVLVEQGRVTGRLPRRTELARGAAGRAATRQPLAANVDVVLVLVSLAAAPSPARLDRLLAVAWDSGGQPVVVLTKADLSRTAESERDEVAETALAAPVLLTSTVDGRGLAELRGHLGEGRTAALLGVSGAGKSSLLNALAGTEVARVGALGAAGKGRHTTTTRELAVLPGLGAVVDTPGLRGVRLWETGGGVETAFADVVALAERCRFRDCRHDGEPGCAVADAVAAGTLSARRVAGHARLVREAAWLRDRYDARLRAEQRRRWRELSRAVRSGRRAARAARGDRPR